MDNPEKEEAYRDALSKLDEEQQFTANGFSLMVNGRDFWINRQPDPGTQISDFTEPLKEIIRNVISSPDEPLEGSIKVKGGGHYEYREVFSDEKLAEIRERNERVSEFLNQCPDKVSSDIMSRFLSLVRAGKMSPDEAAEKVEQETEKERFGYAVRSAVPFYNLAEAISRHEGLTPNEMCHQMARATYTLAFHGHLSGEFYNPPDDFNAGVAYGKLYDRRKAEDIKARLAKSAAELFT